MPLQLWKWTSERSHQDQEYWNCMRISFGSLAGVARYLAGIRFAHAHLHLVAIVHVRKAAAGNWTFILYIYFGACVCDVLHCVRRHSSRPPHRGPCKEIENRRTNLIKLIILIESKCFRFSSVMIHVSCAADRRWCPFRLFLRKHRAHPHKSLHSKLGRASQ